MIHDSETAVDAHGQQQKQQQWSPPPSFCAPLPLPLPSSGGAETNAAATAAARDDLLFPLRGGGSAADQRLSFFYSPLTLYLYIVNVAQVYPKPLSLLTCRTPPPSSGSRLGSRSSSGSSGRTAGTSHEGAPGWPPGGPIRRRGAP